MSRTLIASEDFLPAGAFLNRSTDLINSGNPGYATSWLSGGYAKELHGPGGYSGRPAGYGYRQCTGNMGQWVMEHKWYFIKDFIPVDGNAVLSAVQYNDLSNAFSHVYCKSGGKFGLSRVPWAAPNYSDLTSSLDVPLNRWFKLKTLFYYTVAAQVTYYAIVLIRYVGESSWTTVFNVNWVMDNPGLGFNQVMTGNQVGGGASLICRTGAIKIWTSDTPTVNTDGVTYDDAGPDPSEAQIHYAVANDGDDDNDGSEARPFRSYAPLNTLTLNSGLIPVVLDESAIDAAETILRAALAADQDDVTAEMAACDAAVDAMFENGTGGILHIPDGYDSLGIGLDIQTHGMTILNEGMLDCKQALDAGDWSAVPGHTGLEQITPTGGGMTSVVLFRNQTWLPMLYRQDYGSDAALLTALESAATGTWWCDDTTFYIKGSPSTDGFTYRRTYDRGNNNIGAIRVSYARNMRVIGGSIIGTVRASKLAGAPVADYAVEVGGDVGGHIRIKDIFANQNDKHTIGIVLGSQDVAVWQNNVTCQGTNPFDPAGGTYSPHVDFADMNAGFGADLRSYRSDCDVPFIKADFFTENTGTITLGQIVCDGHNLTGPSFTDTLWIRCELGVGIIDEQGMHVAESKFHAQDCTFGFLVWRAASGYDIRRCTKAGVPSSGTVDETLNLLINSKVITGTGQTVSLGNQGHTLIGNTFDVTGFGGGTLYTDSGDGTLVLKGNLVIGAADVGIFLNGPDIEDSVTETDNVYAANIAAVDVDSDYIPQLGSVLIDGTDATAIPELAGTLDFLSESRPGSGNLTVGAIEYQSAETGYLGGRHGVGLGFGFVLGG